MKRICLFSLWVLLLSACAHSGLPSALTDEPTTSPLPVSQPMATPIQQAYPGRTPTPRGEAGQNHITSQPLDTNASTGEECIRSFAEFAYFNDRIPTLAPKATPEVIPPLSPWRIEAVIPGQKSEANYRIHISRSHKGYMEIWIAEVTSDEDLITVTNYWIYRPELLDWKYISGEIENTSVFADALFVMQDGTVWGKSNWNYYDDQTNIQNVPLLNKFNEYTGQFEYVPGVLEFASKQPEQGNILALPLQITMSKQEMFWIFVDRDGIYSYDPVRMKTEKRADLSNHDIIYVLPPSNRGIYFESALLKNYTFYFDFYRLLPATGKIEQLNIPNVWLKSNGALFDHNDNLWFGTFGYQATNGSWHSILPYAMDENVLSQKNSRGTPGIMLESSSGLLWYSLNSDYGEVSGTAWFDPQTGKGCEFTNLPLDIVEDSEQNLWTVAEGKLYINDTYARQK